MALARCGFSAILGGLLWAVQLSAQSPSGIITGRVVDSTTQQPLSGVSVTIEGTPLGTLSRDNGAFFLGGIPVGPQRVRSARIGYAPKTQEVTVVDGGTVTMEFALQARAAVLSEMVVIGYGSVRREAVTGSVAEVNTEQANVGVISNANDLIRGRAAGVSITQNNGEPGAGAQIRIRGGTSISATNEPLYVIDGVPINNVDAEAAGIGIGGTPPLPRSPLNLINPSDIASITILKDASSTAIYGSRGANGVVMIETKNGAAGGSGIEYDSYVAMSTPLRTLDVLNGDQYRAFIQQQVSLGNLAASRLDNLGQANTNWQDAVTRTATTHNHNLAFSGGGNTTRYRASLNYMDQQGVVLENGFERLQGRLNGTHQTFNDRLRLGLNLTASHLKNDYLAFENTGGFEGGVFTNVAIFNPTRPVTFVDSATGQTRFYEMGTGLQSVRNPVALANQIDDLGNTTRILGNVSAEFDLLPGLTAKMNVGADQSESTRRTYFPLASPVGAASNGLARQVNRDNTSLTLQSYLTFTQEYANTHSFDVVGGYEFNENDLGEFTAQGSGFLTDATGFNNLGGGTSRGVSSFREEKRIVSFFTRATYGFSDRFFLTGVLRRDGCSCFGAGSKWAVFPAVSASWRISNEEFMRGGVFSDLRLRAGRGQQGNPGVPPYSSLILLETSGGARYVFGETPVVGVAPVRNPNPNLKWEQTEQYNLALDYGLLDNRFSGTLEGYTKKTSDLLLEVTVPQPALVATRLENIGRRRSKGLEFSLDAQVLNRPNLGWLAGLVFAAERNEVVNLGGRGFITSGDVSGQGQSDQKSQRILPGYALGTFYGPRFVGVNPQGKQLFGCTSDGPSDTVCVNGQTTTPSADDYAVLGNANPDFTLGLRSLANFGKFDFSFLIRSEIGGEVFNNTALVYATKGNALQDKNFLSSALSDPTGLREPSIFSSRWIEDRTFLRLQNVTLGFTFNLVAFGGQPRTTRVYLSGDNLLLLTGYSGLDPEVHAQAGLASAGIDYLSYPRPRTFTGGVRFVF